MSRGPRIIACIPAYNEDKTISQIVSKTREYVDLVVVCDDGSSDRTYEEAVRAGALVVRHRKNLGYGVALRTLFYVAKRLDPDIVVILDADGQHDPADIPKLVRPILTGEADIVIGSRLLSGTGMPAYRSVGVRLITWPVRMVAYPRLKDAQSGFRAYSRRAIRLIDVTEHGMGASTEILFKGALHGLRIKEVPVTVSYASIRYKISPLKHGILVLLVTIKHALICLIRKVLKKFQKYLIIFWTN